ncbi:MAG: DNA polymerase IV [Desulfarculaceae bacterium]|nr:DNA polymerase IV [Desulfarculaceae bacterium]
MILHIDMDAFFASVEQRDDPWLLGKPVVVAGDTGRSVVSAASYEARRFGIRSAMPVYQAQKLCPGLVVVPVNKTKYAVESGKIMEYLAGFTPLMEQVSVDEAYMDVEGCTRLFGGYKEIAARIKQGIRDHFDLACSVGAAPVKFLAKIASDMDKPDGLVIIEPESAQEFARNLAIEKIPGVGKNALSRLTPLNIRTLGDVKKFDRSTLSAKLGSFGLKLADCAELKDSPVQVHDNRKSVSAETTLPEDSGDIRILKKYLLDHANTVARSLRKKNLRFSTLSIKIKFSDFSALTRQKPYRHQSFSGKSIYNEAVDLLCTVDINKKVRLVGVGVSNLIQGDRPVQIELSADSSLSENRWQQLDKTLDRISGKYGKNIIRNASLNE